MGTLKELFSRWNTQLKAWAAPKFAQLREVASLKDDVDIPSTIDNIKKNVEFKGTNLWVLIFAIAIASLGLNVNSTAVIIGAMLISPLMGPIIGIGFAVSTNDNQLMHRALKNLGIMVFISLVTSTLYFVLSPLGDAQSELLARTRPTIYDVLIALFGGAAGMVANANKDKGMITAVSGVAIATALMPPLCTAGFGIASLNFDFFIGAFYLFFINSFFIALATFIIARYLRFPCVQFLVPEQEKKVKRVIYAFSILVMVPSIITAVSVVNESSFNSRANLYAASVEQILPADKTSIIEVDKRYDKEESCITLTLIGQPLSKELETECQALLHKFKLEQTKLVLKLAGGNGEIAFSGAALSELLQGKDKMLVEKDKRIEQLERALLIHETQKIPSEQLAREAKILFPGVASFAVTKQVFVNIQNLKSDTIPTLCISWHGKHHTAKEKEHVSLWVKERLGLKTLQTINY